MFIMLNLDTGEPLAVAAFKAIRSGDVEALKSMRSENPGPDIFPAAPQLWQH